jgi:DNA repair exonuclease SbcCD ATPase subunit
MGGGASMPAKYMAEEREKRGEEQEQLKETVEESLRTMTENIAMVNSDLAERANVAKQELQDEVVTLKAELRRSIHAETTLKKENKKLAAELEKLQTVVDNLPKTTEQLKEQRRANRALVAENEALAEQIKKYEGMEQAMRALKQKQKDVEEEMDRMQRKVERAEAVQQVNKTLTLRADNLQSDVDRLSSLLEKAAASEQIRKSLTQEEVRKMKSMATKVAQNDKRLSRRNRELEAEVASLEKQLSVHKGYKQAAVKNRELERTIEEQRSRLAELETRASDNMIHVMHDRKKTLEQEVTFLQAQVKKYSEAARDRNAKASRVLELEQELQQVSQPFLNMSRSVTGLNKNIEGMMSRITTELEQEVSGLQEHMEKAQTKVKETELLNSRVKEYETLLMEQQALIEQDRERMRILEAAEAQAKAEAAEAAALEAEAAAAAAEAAALEAANAAETGDESMIEAVNPRWRRDPGDPTPRLASPVKAPRPAADPEQDGGGGEQGGGQGEGQGEAQPHDGEEAVPLQVAPLADVSHEPAASPAELVTPTKAAPETDGDEAVPQPAA